MGVLVDNLAHRGGIYLEIGGLEPMLLALLGQQEVLGYLQFLFSEVAGNVDYLHTVQQGGLHGRNTVGGGNEEYLREVVVQIEVVVVESSILFGIESLEKGG